MTKIAEKIKREFCNDPFQIHEAKIKSVCQTQEICDDSVTFFFEDGSSLTYSGLEIWKSALECEIPLVRFGVDQTKCFCCGRSAKDGWGMYRQNSMGENGIWACKYHNQRI